MSNQAQIIVGNSHTEGKTRRGWFMGYFVTPEDDPRATSAVEVKWGTHTAGDSRQEWGVNHQATTLSILISGRFRLQFPDREVVLAQEGDYALWLPGVPHGWLAEESSTVLTVRYPSVPET
ncbi:MAG TPA: hypothetical protein V6D16_12715 [Candidatus Obscuribacterales bacterium]